MHAPDRAVRDTTSRESRNTSVRAGKVGARFLSLSRHRAMSSRQVNARALALDSNGLPPHRAFPWPLAAAASELRRNARSRPAGYQLGPEQRLWAALVTSDGPTPCLPSRCQA